MNNTLNEKNYDELKAFTHEWGADLFGVADITAVKDKFKLPANVLKNADKAISLAVKLSGSVLEGIEDHPTRLYFHHYRTVNMFLDQLAVRVTNFIQSKGFSALPVPASQILDWEKQLGHLSHKEMASLAGLGWIGRNNLLVNKDLGSRIRLITVLTNMPLKTDSPAEDACGSCQACMAPCPANAIKKERGDFDHIGCFEQLKDFRKKRFVDQFICGICVKACSGKKLDKG